MPIIDGLTATRGIRQMEQTSVRERDTSSATSCLYCACPKYARTPIIGVTASIAEEDRAICLNAGMDDFVEKPISKEVLLRVLGRQLLVTEGHRPQ